MCVAQIVIFVFTPLSLSAAARALKSMAPQQYASLLYALAAMGVQKGNVLLRDAITVSLKHHLPLLTLREFVKVLESLRPVSAPCVAAAIAKEVKKCLNSAEGLWLSFNPSNPHALTVSEVMSLLESLKVHRVHRFDPCVYLSVCCFI